MIPHLQDYVHTPISNTIAFAYSGQFRVLRARSYRYFGVWKIPSGGYKIFPGATLLLLPTQPQILQGKVFEQEGLIRERPSAEERYSKEERLRVQTEVASRNFLFRCSVLA